MEGSRELVGGPIRGAILEYNSAQNRLRGALQAIRNENQALFANVLSYHETANEPRAPEDLQQHWDNWQAEVRKIMPDLIDSGLREPERLHSFTGEVLYVPTVMSQAALDDLMQGGQVVPGQERDLSVVHPI